MSQVQIDMSHLLSDNYIVRLFCPFFPNVIHEKVEGPIEY